MISDNDEENINRWGKLISNDRFKGKARWTPVKDQFLFSSLQKDAERILYSTSFRRLQGKAQVYIFPDTDYVRTRLTHTLEVANIGRVLATYIFNKLKNDSRTSFGKFIKLPKNDVSISDIVESVAAACYAHDIGNPPFGHIGEFAIRSWFKDKFDKIDHPEKWPKDRSGRMNPKERSGLASIDTKNRNDFKYFDGNAQGFRVITCLQGWKYGQGGLQLTNSTLGAFSKYVNNSNKIDKKKAKFGYFSSEEEYFKKIFDSLGLKQGEKYVRHPLSYIVEAADDIAYIVTDVEDGVKRNIINYDDGFKLLLDAACHVNKFDSLSKFDESRVNLIKKSRPNARGGATTDRMHDRIKFLRAGAISALVASSAEEFLTKEDQIFDGRYGSKNIVKESSAWYICEKMKKCVYENVHYNQVKVRRDSGAYETVRYLLNKFSDAAEEYIKVGGKFEAMESERNRNLIRILAKGSTENFDAKDGYQAYQIICDYISGMTDKFATDLCNEIRGVTIRG